MCALAVSDPKSFSMKVAVAMLIANTTNIDAVRRNENTMLAMVFKWKELGCKFKDKKVFFVKTELFFMNICNESDLSSSKR